jgi:hypothetical protein
MFLTPNFINYISFISLECDNNIDLVVKDADRVVVGDLIQPHSKEISLLISLLLKHVINSYIYILIFLTKINDIHSFKLIEYIDTMQIR